MPSDPPRPVASHPVAAQPQPAAREPISYRSAGVDIDAGAALVERIKPAAARTHRPGVLGGLGGFGALFRLDLARYREPVLVTTTDGVGTKLKLALEMERHDTIGIDLVAMCVNDLVVQGAEPLLFLDYFATGRLDVPRAGQIIEGIAAGCVAAGCALVGGETAELPGLYQGEDYDLAGFAVGVVDAPRLIDGSAVRPGDLLLGLASSGAHSNGYSLIRRIVERGGHALDAPFGDAADAATLDPPTLGEALLAPTRIYVKPLLQLFADCEVHALAHITGGGLTDNLPRVLPDGVQACIDLSSWERPALFRWLAAQGPVTEAEMRRTFNCGIGMIVVVPAATAAAAETTLRAAGETVYRIGHIAPRQPGTPALVFAA